MFSGVTQPGSCVLNEHVLHVMPGCSVELDSGITIHSMCLTTGTSIMCGKCDLSPASQVLASSSLQQVRGGQKLQRPPVKIEQSGAFLPLICVF